MKELKDTLLREWVGLFMLGGVAGYLLFKERYDGGIFVAGLILQQLGIRTNIKKGLAAAESSAKSAKSAEQSGEFAVSALQQLTGAQRARLKEAQDFEDPRGGL